MNYSIKQLRAFSCVAQLSSFADAAKVLHVTPAALSVLVRELEKEIGFRVLHRTTRMVALTDQGRAFLVHVERLLGNLKTMDTVAHEICHQRSGLVRIAMTPLMQLALLPPMFETLGGSWPDIRIELVDVPSDQILQRLEAGDADLAIAFETGTSDDLESSPLFSSRLHAVLRPDHQLAGKGAVQWRDLVDEHVVFVGHGMEMRMRARLPQAISFKSGYEASNSITAVALVAGRRGIALGPGYIRQLCAVQDLVALPLVKPSTSIRFMLYRRRRGFATPALEIVRSFIEEYFGRVRQSFKDIGSP